MSEVEAEIREMLRNRADDVEPTVSLPASTLARSRRRRVFNSAAALVTTVAVILGTVVVVDAVRRGPQKISYVEPPIRPKHRTVINIGGAPQEIAIGAGAVWAERQDEIVRIDPNNNRVVAHIDAVGSSGGRPVRIRYYFGARGLAVGDGAVWATGTRFTESVGSEPSQRSATPTTPPDPLSAYRWSLLKIDPTTNTWVAALPAYTGSITGSLPTSMVAGPGAVWVATEGSSLSDSGAVYHFDTNSEEATKIVVDGPATGIALVDGFVWATVDVNRAGARGLVKIDPKTDRVVQTVLLPGTIVLQGLAVSDGALWVPVLRERGSPEIVRVDATSGRIVARIPVRGPVPLIVASPEAIWFSVQDDRQLFRIDPKLNHIDGRLSVGGVPDAIAVDGSTLWVATDPDSGGGPKPPIFVRYDL